MTKAQKKARIPTFLQQSGLGDGQNVQCHLFSPPQEIDVLKQTRGNGLPQAVSGPLYRVPITYGLATADTARMHEQAQSRQAALPFQVWVFMKEMCAIGKFHSISPGKSAKKLLPASVAKPMKEYQIHLIWLTWYNA
jgi:hypothetical protein